MPKQYRGLSVAIRRKINFGELTGELDPFKIRLVMANNEKFKAAPDKTITQSLNYLLGNNEILYMDGKYYTKDYQKQDKQKEALKPSTPPVQTPLFQQNIITKNEEKQQVLVLGKLVGTEIVNGKMVARVEVISLDYK